MTIQQYFDEALRMEEGSKIMIPCANFNEQESVRVQLYRARGKYAKSVGRMSENLAIFRCEIEGKLFIVLEKRSHHGAVLIRADGTVKSLDALPEEDRVLQRIIKAAIEDQVRLDELTEQLVGSYSEEEIRLMFNKLSQSQVEDATNGSSINKVGVSEVDNGNGVNE